MRWSGHLTRALSGGLWHPPLHDANEADHIAIAAELSQDGTLLLKGEVPNRHWHGEINKARDAWWLSCAFGFHISGTVRWEGGRFVLTQTHHRCPPEFLLPGETDVVEVSA